MIKGKKLRALVQDGVSLKEVNGYGVIHLTYNDREQPLNEWAAEAGIHEHTLYLRLRAGWTIEKALLTPTQKQEDHGHTDTPEWVAWRNMRSMCNNPKDKRYNSYGGRGIKVCRQWDESFQEFFDNMGPQPSKKHSLERVNNDGHYEPNNVVWATQEIQCRNTLTNVELTHNGQTMILKDWARETGLANTTLWNRLFTLKWSVERALTTPQRRKRG